MEGYDGLKLENQLCFPLYVCAKEVVRRYKPLLDGLGLTYTQYIAMMALWERRSLSVKELGGILYLDSGTLTPLLKKLEEKGYVLRSRSPEDERVLDVSLTPEGEALKEKARSVPESMMSCLRIPPEDAAELARILRGIMGTLRGGR
ncbi:MAG: MarR family transcriptional regulator [Candidatus Methanomethylophilaceae archaeon]|nr:MarR family transcriptional regulator [Candidatus Methanomethylophilaceae archaeon]